MPLIICDPTSREIPSGAEKPLISVIIRSESHVTPPLKQLAECTDVQIMLLASSGKSQNATEGCRHLKPHDETQDRLMKAIDVAAGKYLLIMDGGIESLDNMLQALRHRHDSTPGKAYYRVFPLSGATPLQYILFSRKVLLESRRKITGIDSQELTDWHLLFSVAQTSADETLRRDTLRALLEHVSNDPACRENAVRLLQSWQERWTVPEQQALLTYLLTQGMQWKIENRHLSEELSTCRTTLLHCQRIEHAFRQLTGSRSWRLTEPLRKLGDAARQIRHRLKARRLTAATDSAQQEEIDYGAVPDADKLTLAVIIHAFYPDVFAEILDTMPKVLLDRGTIHVTTPEEKVPEIRKLASARGVDIHIMAVPNHGRDVLPFLKVLNQIKGQEPDLILKLHTKKSLHREDGDKWRNDVYEKLLSPALAQRVFGYFTQHDDVGLIGPEGHIAPLSYYWGYNEHTVRELARRMGVRHIDEHTDTFVAGTMFFARREALAPLLELELSDHDFEKEAGQLDGTMAHAVERAIAVSAAVKGMRIASTKDVCATVDRGVSIQKIYSPRQ